MTRPFEFNKTDRRLMARSIAFADARRDYHIFGMGIRKAADRLANVGLISLESCAPKQADSRLRYYAVRPTERGRTVWYEHSKNPVQKPSGGANAVLSPAQLDETEQALARCSSITQAAISLGLCVSAVRYRMLRLDALGRRQEMPKDSQPLQVAPGLVQVSEWSLLKVKS